MSNKTHNGIGLRAEWERSGLGLNSSGSYVLPSFDTDELALNQRTDFSRLEFSDEDHVVVAEGKRGSLAKFAKVTKDKKYARYFGAKCVSVALIQGRVFTKAEFIQSIAENPVVKVVKATNGKEFIGILFGKRDASYKSLVYPGPAGFHLLDLEENPPPQASAMQVRFLPLDPTEGHAIKTDLVKRFS